MDTLPKLTRVVISNTRVTARSVTLWAQHVNACQASAAACQSVANACQIADVDLSYNNLRGATLDDVASVLSLPNLSALNLTNCGLVLTDSGSSMRPCNVNSLHLGYNSFNSVSLKLLLMNTPKITSLSLSGVKIVDIDSNKEAISMALSNILGGGNECSLERLNLSQCSLSNNDVSTLLSYLCRCPRLFDLDLSHNPDIVDSLLALVSEAQFSNITQLRLHGIENCSEVIEGLCTMVQQRMLMEKHVRFLSYMRCVQATLPTRRESAPPDALEGCFVSLYSSRCAVNKLGRNVFIDLKY